VHDAVQVPLWHVHADCPQPVQVWPFAALVCVHAAVHVLGFEQVNVLHVGAVPHCEAVVQAGVTQLPEQHFSPVPHWLSCVHPPVDVNWSWTLIVLVHGGQFASGIPWSAHIFSGGGSQVVSKLKV
jgi:hypothetical protein